MVRSSRACAVVLSARAVFRRRPRESYPDRPIRLISPNPAGGANDTIVRIVAAKMSTMLDTPIVVDNRGGAGGKIGAEAVAHAPAGRLHAAGRLGRPPIRSRRWSPPSSTYDPIKDFEPISLFALVQNLLVVNPKLAAHDRRRSWSRWPRPVPAS